METRRVTVSAVAVSIAALTASTARAPRAPRGTYKRIRGQFKSIHAAVDAARPGDWILIAPRDYKTRSSRHPGGRPDLPAGVLITKRNIRIRGMNRNTR